MSYCRFSSNDFQCDVYVYEDVTGGFTTHVAANRLVYSDPLPPRVDFDESRIAEWIARQQQVSKMIEEAHRVHIGLPHDGESFNDSDAASCADRLEQLRALGYIVPQYAIDTLREESNEEGAA